MWSWPGVGKPVDPLSARSQILKEDVTLYSCRVGEIGVGDSNKCVVECM